jgi:DNA-binding transcriptional regulator YiaG
MLFRKYKDPDLRSIYEGARVLYKIGAISAERMREYDEGCLEPVKNPFARFFPRPVPSLFVG